MNVAARPHLVSILALVASVSACETFPRDALAPSVDPVASTVAFERFKGLAGTWQGKSTKGWAESITYQTIAGGSCVLETSFDAHPKEQMATMFHMDGRGLVLTHYCVAKNQPRLLATRIEDGGARVTFTFLDATNLPTRDRGHMDKVVFRFVDADHFTSQWSWYEDGRESWMEEIAHTRIPGRDHADADPAIAGGT